MKERKEAHKGSMKTCSRLASFGIGSPIWPFVFVSPLIAAYKWCATARPIKVNQPIEIDHAVQIYVALPYLLWFFIAHRLASESGAIVVSFVTPKIDLDGHDNGWKMKRKVLAVTQTRGISLRKERMVGETETQYPVSCPSSDSRVTRQQPLSACHKRHKPQEKTSIKLQIAGNIVQP
jgi:hypothetical protein